ncbi:IS66 family transposase [Verrucomicrobiota bacterium sgz303538]
MKITSRLFEAFLECPTKCFLLAAGEQGSGNAYADWVEAHQKAYAAQLIERMRNDMAGCQQIQECTVTNIADFADCQIVTNVRLTTGRFETEIHVLECGKKERSADSTSVIPYRFVASDKLTTNQKLTLAFDALAIAELTGASPRIGVVVHGRTAVTRKLSLPPLVKVAQKHLEESVAVLGTSKAPELILNRHCPACIFRDRCRATATEKDDLSLLSGMTAKERTGFHKKGIFTLTQLSYTWRPRRSSKASRKVHTRYKHSLKALAIREKAIHVVGEPNLNISGTPVFLDVEGLPDRNFYYLIGVKIGTGDESQRHSFWADTEKDERHIWIHLLDVLAGVSTPVLVHYGRYETDFIKYMTAKYGTKGRSTALRTALQSSVNLLSFLYGRFYFPTYSNGLKEIAGFLGFRWSEPIASGIQTVAWRHQWEQQHDTEIKTFLTRYNLEDCDALSMLVEKIPTLSKTSIRPPTRNASFSDTCNAPPESAEIYKSFETIIKSAHQSYESGKIKLRKRKLGKDVGTKQRKSGGRRILPRSNNRIVRVASKRLCPLHGANIYYRKKPAERQVIDIAFSSSGCRRIIIRYVGKIARCTVCNCDFVPPAFKRLEKRLYGAGIEAWIAYHRIVLRLSYRLIATAILNLFHENINSQLANTIVDKVADDHLRTEARLLKRLLESPFLHVDETRLNISGVQQYVWVITNGSHVILRLSESRESIAIEGILGDYAGVVISDFYGAYDTLPCRQQKCLVHLLRDLNEDLYSHPFDHEYQTLVAALKALLLPIFADVEKFGLKRRNLRKHQPRVHRFYADYIEGGSSSELVSKYHKRFLRYRDSLFTFLENDGVSWNNNMAERAIRPLAIQRKISGAFTKRGATGHLRLLSIAQTCKFQSKSFLDFLRSGMKDVDAFS